MIDYDTIKRSIPIHTVLRKYGFAAPERTSYRIACPLHGGKDANFSVSERSGLWNCFSICQRGGSVIDLVAALEKIDIKEAAQKLSSDFNIGPSRASVAVARDYSGQMERYKKMNNETMMVVLPPHRQLEEGYRGLSRFAIQHWQLGRTDTGVLIPSVGNGGLTYSYAIRRDDGNPKYEIGKGTSKAWPYGLWQNQNDIVHDGFVYIVEGQFDAIAMWEYGYRNVVAIQGSQISDQQAMLLLLLTSTLMLVMDGDVAGRKATEEITKKWGAVFKVGKFELPEGIDPDEYLLKGGRL